MDNSTSFGIFNETIKQKRSKEMDMRCHWLTDRVRQKQFDMYWQPGPENLGDYYTNHHSAQHHKDMRILILHRLTAFRFCEGVLNYSHSRNLTCARAHIHRHSRVPREPHSSEECWSGRTLSQYIT
jgi:hypothetical protein